MKTFIRPEIFVYIALLFFSIAFLVLRNFVPATFSGELLLHYAALNNVNFLNISIFAVALLLSWFLWWLIFSRAIRLGKDFLFAGILILIGLYVLLLVLTQLNTLNKDRLNDELLFRADTIVTGTFPALTLASFSYPSWFGGVVHFAFVYFAAVFLFFFIFLFPLNRKLFLEAAGTFSLALVLAFFLWLLFPALSPHDRFIDNVYKLPIPKGVETYLDAYKPQEEIVEFLKSIRMAKEGLTVFPTNTFPSSHALGGVGLVYFVWRFRRWTGYLITPFVLLSSFGAVLFAQHYFVDMITGGLVAAISIWVIRVCSSTKN